MQLKALFFGSTGVLAETSDIQRRAYNHAMAEAGLKRHWSAHFYKSILEQSDGRARLERLIGEAGSALSEDAIMRIHDRKTMLACSEIVSTRVPLRPGVENLVRMAQASRLKLALVTPTDPKNVDAIFTATQGRLARDSFDIVLTLADCQKPIPDSDLYKTALSRLGLDASEVIAIADSEASTRAAAAAGIVTIATPGTYTANQDYSAAAQVLQSLEDFHQLAGAA